jgi:hypothetical protein
VGGEWREKKPYPKVLDSREAATDWWNRPHRYRKKSTTTAFPHEPLLTFPLPFPKRPITSRTNSTSIRPAERRQHVFYVCQTLLKGASVRRWSWIEHRRLRTSPSQIIVVLFAGRIKVNRPLGRSRPPARFLFSDASLCLSLLETQLVGKVTVFWGVGAEE